MTGQGFQDLGLQATSTGGGCACCSPTSHATAATDTGRFSHALSMPNVTFWRSKRSRLPSFFTTM